MIGGMSAPPEEAAASMPAACSDRKPELFINRELSLLEFNRRVLEQAKDKSVPLLERLRFLSICSTNLDEFFEIRVAGLKQQVEFEIDRVEADGLLPTQALRQISDHVVA